MAEATDVPTALLDAIRVAASDQSLEWARPPVTLTGGFWAEMWRVELVAESADLRGPLVARIMPDAEVAARETTVQAHLADHGFPTPRVHLSDGPGPALALAWMLMDLAPGEPLLADLSGIRAIARLPQLARRLPDQLARHAATLHAIDPGEVPSQRGVGALLASLGERSATIGRRDLVAVAEWLDDHRPPGGRAVICHGDLHPFNILSHPSGDTVLDWSTAQITDPAYDVAYTRILLGHPPLSAPGPVTPIIAAAGRALARRFVDTYNKAAPQSIDPEQLDWFTHLHTLRVVAQVATWEANDELGQHADHPYLLLAPTLTEHLARRTATTHRA